MTALTILLKASILMSSAALIHALIGRRMSAASRHLMWTLTIAGLLLLPVLSLVLPAWPAFTTTIHGTPVPAPMVLPASSDIPAPVVASTAWPTRPASPPTIPWSAGFAMLYLTGVAFFLARLIMDRLGIRQLLLRATAVSDPQWIALLLDCTHHVGFVGGVKLLRSREETMPMAFGIRRGAIVIPAVADTWTEDRRRAVLLHEIAHLSRHDCPIQMLTAVACAFYWVHPGVWWIERRLRVERELACDDRVLSAGADASDYASHLLELAYALRSGRPPVLAVSMAGSGQLEGRMLALLDAARNRAIPALRNHLAGLVILLVLLVPLAAATISSRHLTAASESTQLRRITAAEPLPDPKLPGTWDIRPTDQPRIVQVGFREAHSSYSSTIDMDHTDGFPIAQYQNADGPVQFSVSRDAGAFTFEGIVRSGVGAGTYTFVPSTTFPDEMVKRGFDRPSAGEQRVLARADIGFAYLDELTSQHYTKPTQIAELVRAAQHGVNLSYLRAMGGLGYRLANLDGLIELQNHGISPGFVRELVAEGLSGLSVEDLLRARGSGVDPEFIRGFSELGYPKLSLDALIGLRQHGVDPEFTRNLATLGYEKLPLDRLIELRNHGVDPDYIRELATQGYAKLSLDTLIELRNHGVDPEYVKKLQSVGYGGLKAEELVALRNAGIDADNIRRANERAGRRLSVEDLRALAARGWR